VFFGGGGFAEDEGGGVEFGSHGEDESQTNRNLGCKKGRWTIRCMQNYQPLSDFKCELLIRSITCTSAELHEEHAVLGFLRHL
jgi:hypothetical protein